MANNNNKIAGFEQNLWDTANKLRRSVVDLINFIYVTTGS